MPPADWIAVMRAADMRAGHIEFVQADEVEVALWRDSAGAINAWENRCPHRGVRLTIGSVSGDELTCRYHGWRFRTQTGACSFIPAHPGQTPPPASRLATYVSTERYGLVWLHLGDPVTPPFIEGLDEGVTALRSLPFRAPAGRIGAATIPAVEPLGAHRFRLELDGGRSSAQLFVQPEDAQNCVVHGVIERSAPDMPLIDNLRAYNDQLNLLRQALEAQPVYAG